MIDLHLMRALEASRRIVKEELEPQKAPRPMIETTPKHVSGTPNEHVKLRSIKVPKASRI